MECIDYHLLVLRNNSCLVNHHCCHLILPVPDFASDDLEWIFIDPVLQNHYYFNAYEYLYKHYTNAFS